MQTYHTVVQSEVDLTSLGIHCSQTYKIVVPLIDSSQLLLQDEIFLSFINRHLT